MGPQSTCHAPDRGACALRIPQLLGLMDENTVLSALYWKPYSLPAGGKQAHSRQSDEVEVCILIWMALSTLEEGMLLEVQGVSIRGAIRSKLLTTCGLCKQSLHPPTWELRIARTAVAR